LAKLDLLVLDELGYVPASKAGAELLFDVIATAYERNSVVVTTNLPFENWTEVLGSERLTGAALDRLTHRCHILETKGESYPRRQAATAAGGLARQPNQPRHPSNSGRSTPRSATISDRRDTAPAPPFSTAVNRHVQ
jgi:hypothetical protein